jgi:DNA-binding HxlR family transcriptional regulator
MGRDDEMEDGTLMEQGHTCVTAAESTRAVLALTGDKWTLLVVINLDGRTRRFMDLKRDIPGISQRMLTRTLRQLERDGLVHRTVYPTVPPRVEYRLTGLGTSLFQAIRPLGLWANENAKSIDEARQAFDDRPPVEPMQEPRIPSMAIP